MLFKHKYLISNFILFNFKNNLPKTIVEYSSTTKINIIAT